MLRCSPEEPFSEMVLSATRFGLLVLPCEFGIRRVRPGDSVKLLLEECGSEVFPSPICLSVQRLTLVFDEGVLLAVHNGEFKMSHSWLSGFSIINGFRGRQDMAETLSPEGYRDEFDCEWIHFTDHHALPPIEYVLPVRAFMKVAE